LGTALDEKYESVLAHERSWAKAVALAAMRPKPLTVWEVLIPIFIIFNHMRLKGAREVFAQNILFTKKMALDAAFSLTSKGLGREEALAPILERTSALLTSDTTGIYSEQIRRNQLKEIDLLIEHYRKLLRADGEDHASLIIHAYSRQSDYIDFLEQLSTAEKDVNMAAVETLGSQADTEMLSRIEQASHRIRMAAADRIFEAAP